MEDNRTVSVGQLYRVQAVAYQANEKLLAERRRTAKYRKLSIDMIAKLRAKCSLSKALAWVVVGLILLDVIYIYMVSL